jgi:hypothetical protein
MAESSLSLSYRDFQTEVGFFLGYGRTYTSWTAAQIAMVDACIQTGLRKFYHPLIPGTDQTYEWKFLKIKGAITTIASYTTGTVTSSGTSVTLATGTWPTWAAINGLLVVDGMEHPIASRTSGSIIVLSSAPSVAFSADTFELRHDGNYDLPEDWNGWACKGLTFQPEEYYNPVRFVPEGNIRNMRQVCTTRQRPAFAAVRSKSGTTATTGQRFELLLYPIPDDVYILDGLYDVLLNKIDATTAPFPYGGGAHSEAIMESCLAAAEKSVNDAVGLHKGLFQEALLASIAIDKNKDPDFYGYNGDNSENRLNLIKRSDFVTYEGVLYTGE